MSDTIVTPTPTTPSTSAGQADIEFSKYLTRGPYHWQEISSSLRDHNAFVRARYDAILQAAGSVAGARVLDLGCGDAALSFLLRQQGATVVGTDLDWLGVDWGRRQWQEQGEQAALAMANGYDLPFADQVFDCVICSEVIEHVQRPGRLLAEMRRVLTSTGRFVLTTPCRLHEHPERFHAHEFFPDELKALLLKAGFVDVAVQLSHPVAMSDLYALRWPLAPRRPFHHLFNLASILGANPFNLTGFRTYELLIATGQNKAPHG